MMFNDVQWCSTTRGYCNPPKKQVSNKGGDGFQVSFHAWGAQDLGLGVHCDFAVAKYGSVYKEVLGDEFPEEGLRMGVDAVDRMTMNLQITYCRWWPQKDSF